MTEKKPVSKKPDDVKPPVGSTKLMIFGCLLSGTNVMKVSEFDETGKLTTKSKKQIKQLTVDMYAVTECMYDALYEYHKKKIPPMPGPSKGVKK